MAEGLFLGATLDEQGEIGAPWRLKADHLRTHAVIVGMTGSGKTGLSLVLLEELVRTGVPVIAIDPKGDLGNLGLLLDTAEEFAPWVADGDPAQVAARWHEGLAGWGLGGEQLRSLREHMALTLYTPGSQAGVAVDVLGAFRRPAGAEDPDTRRGLVTSTVSGLLGLAGHKVDAVRDPAHIVLSRILDDAWGAGEDPDLETLILRLVDPPFTKVGVFPLDRFYPPDDRMDLAMTLNGILASPAFEPWSVGATLDIDAMLRPAERTPVSVFSLAHLPEGQRAFFLSLLLGRLHAWSRRQPGAQDLRAALFFDEVAGWLPPHPKNPPTKTPLLTMMKQARAVGLGVVLATQNPVDLDYKALSNAGLWAIGRLQTRQDRDRLLKGLGRTDLDDRVEALGKRQFLVHDARESEPVVIASRHAMCYLRGPFTRAEVKRFSASHGLVSAPSVTVSAPAPVGSVHAASAAVAPAPVTPPAPAVDDGRLPVPPPAPGTQWFLDPRVVFAARMQGVFTQFAEPPRPDGKTAWVPGLLAHLQLHFDEERAGFVLDEELWRLYLPLGSQLSDAPLAVPLESQDLLESAQGVFEMLPQWLDESSELRMARRQVVDAVYRTQSRGMWSNGTLRLYGNNGESREDFDARCADAVQERVDIKVEKIRDRYERQADRLEDRIRRQESKISELNGASRTRQAEELVNIGETVFSLFSGRRRSLSSAVSRRRQTIGSKERLSRAQADLAALREDAYELENKLAQEIERIRKQEERVLERTKEKEIRLEKNDIHLAHFGVLWVPVTRRV